jgi:hypothetical protein
MRNAASDGATIPSGDRTDAFNAIVADLASLISQLQTSTRLVESAIADQAARDDQEAADIVVLDDVMPCYLKAHAALNSCRTGLGAALHYLLDAKPDERKQSHLRLASSASRP